MPRPFPSRRPRLACLDIVLLPFAPLCAGSPDFQLLSSTPETIPDPMQVRLMFDSFREFCLALRLKVPIEQRQNKEVKTVPVITPPMITTANGRAVSAPTPLERPSAAIQQRHQRVMTMGRTREVAPSWIDSIISLLRGATRERVSPG